MMLDITVQHRFAGFGLDVAFTAPAGVTALFGRSGSGKTSVINAVAGLLRPDQGRITVGDAVLLDTGRGVNLAPHRRRVGYVFQDARLFPHLTVRQNLLYGARFAPGAGENPDRIIDLLGIGPLLARRPATLSGGEKQRVAIGRAILSNPRLLALDEPLAALDEARKAEILPYLERLRDELALPILYVSHALGEVVRLANTVVLIEAGRVTACGPTAAVLSDPAHAAGLGAGEAGALLRAEVTAHEGDGLTRLDSAAGPLFVPEVPAPVGTRLSVRILARDVMLATTRPEGLSALIILPATVRDIRPDGAAAVLVQLDAGGEAILARVTRRSAAALDLAPGKAVFAIVKSVSVAEGSLVSQGPAAAPESRENR